MIDKILVLDKITHPFKTHFKGDICLYSKKLKNVGLHILQLYLIKGGT